MVIIYFFGPDGAGKSTLAKKLAWEIHKRGHKTKLSWMRGSHTIASLLAKILSRSDFFKGSHREVECQKSDCSCTYGSFLARLPCGHRLKPQIIDFYESLARGGGRDDDYQRVVLPSNDKRSEYHTTLCHVG